MRSTAEILSAFQKLLWIDVTASAANGCNKAGLREVAEAEETEQERGDE